MNKHNGDFSILVFLCFLIAALSLLYYAGLKLAADVEIEKQKTEQIKIQNELYNKMKVVDICIIKQI